MRILYLSDSGVEHMADFLYNGFVELYGHENVIDFPYKPRYHVKKIDGEPYTYWCSCLDNDIGSDNRKHYSISDFEEIKQLVNNKYFDLIIASTRAYNIFAQLKSSIWPMGTIVINGEDLSNESYRHMAQLFSPFWNNIDMILQREYKYNMSYDHKVVPFPCPCPTRNLPNLGFKKSKDKEIDIFCYLGDTHPFRKKLRERISQISGIKSVVSSDHLSISDYFKYMNNSKICIMAGGVGWETTHYLDIPFAKSMLLAQHPKNAIYTTTLKEDPIVYPNNFKDKQSAVFYKNDLSDIETLIKYYLSHDKEREEIAKRGYEHLMNNLTCKHIAEYVIKCRFDLDYWKSLI